MMDRAGAAVRNLWPRAVKQFVLPKMLAVMALALVSLAGAPFTTAAADPIAARIDAELSAAYPAGGPGAAAIVVRDGKPILRKGYGMANVELGVPNAPDTVFRIGSMTKQFTAVAVLMLVQDGKIAFDDPLTKFLPNYPARGEKITIENLLTHTTGIRSYTEMPDFESNMRNDYTVPEMIDHFAKEPLDFPPGTQWHYDNSGYFLLGAVIERASGMAWGAFLQQRILDPLKMKGTYIGSNDQVIPHRASGYSHDENGKLMNAALLSMTQPYAAGVLFSTVDDLARWDEALYTDKLVRSELLARAWTAFRLPTGASTGYGYGWEVGSWDGHRVIEHDGGINGFSSDGVRLPDDHLFVAVLSNDEDHQPGADTVAERIVTEALGKPYDARPRIEVPERKLREYVGIYRIDAGSTRNVTYDAGKLYTQRSGGRKAEAIPTAPDQFFYAETLNTLRFDRDSAGKVVGMTMSSFGREPEKAVLSDEKPVERTAIHLDPARLDGYVGRFELAPGFVLTITRDGDRLWAQATGQSRIEILPESERMFFLREVDARLEFALDAQGVATGLTLHQGGQDVPGKKLQ